MNISQTTLRIGVALGTIGAIVVLAVSAQAATSKPTGMSQAEYALVIRSEALNKLYGNAVTLLSPRQFKELYQAGGNWMTPQAATSKPTGMSQAEYALMIRSEALNRLYGNAVTLLSPRQFKELYQAGGNWMTPQAATTVAASEALNRHDGLERTSRPTKVVEQPTGNGFDWGDFGIGAAAMLGLVLLSGGLLAGAHLGRKMGARPRSVS